MVGTWLPFYSKREGQLLPTDALNILRLPWLSNDYLRETAKAGQNQVQINKLLNVQIKTAEEAMEQVKRTPNDLKALFNACCQLHLKGDPRALDFARAALELPSPTPATRGILLDFYITIGLDHALLAAEPKGRAWLDESLELDRTGVGNLATYGAGLIDFGEDTEGINILEDAARRSKFSLNLAYTHVFLAIGKRKQGRIDEAQVHAKKAFKFYPKCTALKRIADLLPRQIEASTA